MNVRKVKVEAFDLRSNARIHEHGVTWFVNAGPITDTIYGITGKFWLLKTKNGFLKWWPEEYISFDD